VHGDADSVKQAESEPVSRANRCSARQCSLFGQVLGSLSEGSWKGSAAKGATPSWRCCTAAHRYP